MDCLQILLERGADALDAALNKAAEKGHADCLSVLIDAGARGFDNALLGSAIGGHSECLAVLLAYGRINTINTALYFVSGLNESDSKSQCLKLLADYDSSPDAALRIAIQHGNQASMASLIDLGADLEAALVIAAGGVTLIALSTCLNEGQKSGLQPCKSPLNMNKPNVRGF